VGHVVSIGEMRNEYKLLEGNLKGVDYSEDLGVGGDLISD
jgi:hypothetical protein